MASIRDRVRRAAGALAAGLALLALACAPSPEERLEQAIALQEAGQTEASIPLLEAVLAARPGDPTASYRLGMALVRTGKPHLAVWPLERASETVQYRVPAGLLLATAFYQTLSYDGAIRAATGVLEVKPRSVGALAIRALAYEADRHLEEAVADAEQILTIEPDHFQALLVRARAFSELERTDDAEAALIALHEAALTSQDPAAPAACLFLVHFLVNQRDDSERAGERLGRCREAFPKSLVVLEDVARFYDGLGEPEKATAILRETLGADPADVRSRALLAQRLRNVGELDEARALLRESAEKADSAEGWRALADFLLAGREVDAALEASERAVALAPDDESLRFYRGELLIDAGHLEEAEQIVAALHEPAFRDLLRGHLLYQRGNLDAARKALDAGLRLWPGHPGARALAAKVALGLGRFDEAESHYQEAARATEGAHRATLELARLVLARGDPERALGYARMAATHAFQRMEAYLLAAQCSTALGDFEGARRWLRPLLQIPAQRTVGVAALATVDARERGPEAALATLEKSGLDPSDPENERVLRVWVENLVAAGRTSEALARVEAASARQPDSAGLEDLRGRLLVQLGHTDEAQRAFEKALGLEPELAPALEGLAVVRAEAGALVEALALLERASRAAPEEPAYAYRATQILRRLGRREEALEGLTDLVHRFPGAADARNDLAWLLAERSEDLATARRLAEEAVRIDPQANFLDTLGWVQLRQGEARTAVASFRHALESEPGSALIRYHLGLALAAAGEGEAAIQALQRAVDDGLGAEAAQAREKIAELQRAAASAP